MALIPLQRPLLPLGKKYLKKLVIAFWLTLPNKPKIFSWVQVWNLNQEYPSVRNEHKIIKIEDQELHQ